MIQHSETHTKRHFDCPGQVLDYTATRTAEQSVLPCKAAMAVHCGLMTLVWYDANFYAQACCVWPQTGHTSPTSHQSFKRCWYTCKGFDLVLLLPQAGLVGGIKAQVINRQVCTFMYAYCQPLFLQCIIYLSLRLTVQDLLSYNATVTCKERWVKRLGRGRRRHRHGAFTAVAAS